MNPDDKAKYLERRSEPPSIPSGLVEQEERAELNGFVFIARLLSGEAVRLQTAAGPGVHQARSSKKKEVSPPEQL